MLCILAADSATERCSLALYKGERCFVQASTGVRQHTDSFFSMLQALLEEAELTLAELDLLAFSNGPGNFSGVRLTVGVMQGIAEVLKVPVVTYSTLQVLAQMVDSERLGKRVLVVQDAKMGEWYVGQYQGIGKRMEALEEDLLLSTEKARLLIEQFRADVVVGDGVNFFKPAYELSAIKYPDARVIGLLAREDWEQNNLKRQVDVLPRYLRDKEAWKR